MSSNCKDVGHLRTVANACGWCPEYLGVKRSRVQIPAARLEGALIRANFEAVSNTTSRTRDSSFIAVGRISQW